MLTGNYTFSDVNGDMQGDSTYKWYRSDNAAGLNRTEITGATAQTYVLTSSDEGKYISFEVTPVALSGITHGIAVESSRTGVIGPAEAAPTATVQPITGTLQVGKTLTGNYTYSDVNGDMQGASIYKWFRSDNDTGLNKIEIAGANFVTYVLTSSDEGKYISFEVTPVALSGTLRGVAVESSRTGVIVPAEAAPTATVQPITGTLKVGYTLTGNYTFYDVNGDMQGGSIYKWYRSDNASGLNKIEIAGAIGKTYVLTSSDEDKYISFEVTPVALTGTLRGVAVESDRVFVFAEAAPTATSVEITGTLEVGETLTGNYDFNDVNEDEEGTSTYKWYRADDATGLNKTEIAGATAQVYVLTDADRGKYISFEVTPVALTGITQGVAVESTPVGTVKDILTAAYFTFIPPSGNLTYDGNAKEVSFNRNQDVGGNITIYYQKSGSTEWTSTAPKDAGIYSVKIDVVGNNQYKAATDLTASDWKFTIDKASITATPNENQWKYYGMADPVLTYLISNNGYDVNEPAFTGTLSRQSGETPAANTYKIVQGSLALADNGSFKASNYELSVSTEYFTINSFTSSESASFSPDGNNGWFKTSNVVLKAPDGFKISASNELSGNTWTDSITLDSADGNSKVATYYLRKTENGAISEQKTVQYKVDKSIPTNIKIQYNDNGFKSFMNTISYGVFFKENVDVTAEATDDLSGVASYQFYASDKEIKITDFSGVQWQNNLSLKESSKKVVYKKITDKAGNEVITNNEGVVVYTDSTVTPNVADFDKNTDKQVDVDFTMTLNGNTFKDIKNGTKELVKDTDYTVNGNTITVKKAYFNAQANGNVTLTFSFYPMGVQNDDNISTASVTVNVKDTTRYHNLSKVEVKEKTYTQGGKNGLEFKLNAALSDLDSISVDGKVIDKDNYTTAEDSTIVILKADYLATLSTGKHTLSINSTTGSASAEFTIAAKPGNKKSVQTGDNSNTILWLALLLVSGGTLTTLDILKKRKKKATRN